MAICTGLLIGACSDPSSTHQIQQQPLEFKVSSLGDLNALFDKENYNVDNWNQVDREIPRITFEGVSSHWSKNSSQLPVETKKTIFFRLMAPLILAANEGILSERKNIQHSTLSNDELLNIAVKYRVIENNKVILTESMRAELLTRVDIIPASLALAQSAEESGWGTSRFAVEGNAFFGQWDFSGNGMKPKQKRKQLGNYGVARFDNPLDSVLAYMLNINSNSAYQKLRDLRVKIHNENRELSGYELATTLDKYSERGQAYIDGLQQMIRYNKLQQADSLILSNDKLIHLVPTS